MADVMDYTTLLPQLTLKEKVSLLSGNTFTSTPSVERLGIPRTKLSDGVNGIRPEAFNGDVTSATLPNTICLGCTWDVDLMHRLGREVAKQARTKSAQVVLGPNLGLVRDPRGGRNFETFGEDPFLIGQLSAALINGIQESGVGACPKHLVCNESEYMRHYYDVQESVDGRALREIYLKAWQYMFRASDPATIMTAYNKVDGTYCNDNKPLIDIVRQTFGFKGLVMSDWFANKSTIPSIKAGLDLEMPFPVWRGPKLIEAVSQGLVQESEIDAMVHRALELRNFTRNSQQNEPERSEYDQETVDLLRKAAADGMVLLKNSSTSSSSNDSNDSAAPAAALPLDLSRPGKIIVVGEYADSSPVITGGGSASCNPQYKLSPLQCLRDSVPPHIEIVYSRGVRCNRLLHPPPTSLLRDGTSSISYFNSSSSTPQTQTPIHTEPSKPSTPSSFWMLGPPRHNPILAKNLHPTRSFVKITSFLTPSVSGPHTLGARTTGKFSLFLDNSLLLSGPQPDLTTEQFLFNPKRHENVVSSGVYLEAGREYEIVLEVHSREPLLPVKTGEPVPFAGSLLFAPPGDVETEGIEEAVSAVTKEGGEEDGKEILGTVIFAGRNHEYESEGFDMDTTRLPKNQEGMISAVSRAAATATAKKGKSILVLHAGNMVDVSPFVDDVDAVLLAQFPGQEGSMAIVDLLLGKRCPSGRLGVTWWHGDGMDKGSPSWGDFPARTDVEGLDGQPVLKYGEGVGMGYRGVVTRENERKVRWGFGFGLSYTRFGYEGLRVGVVEKKGGEEGGEDKVRCEVEVKNVGRVAGAEVVQVYIEPPTSSSTPGVWRPEKELKGFAKVFLEPGEKKTVSVYVDLKMGCSYWDEGLKRWVMEQGEYGVLVGGLKGKFSVKERVEWDHL